MTNTFVTSSILDRKSRYNISICFAFKQVFNIEIIKILKKYSKRLKIEDIVNINKFFIFKRDFFTIYNITKVIY